MPQQPAEENKRIARQCLEAFARGNFGDLEKITDTHNFRLHYPGRPEPLTFNEAVSLNKEYRLAFPEGIVAIESQLAEHDLVFTRLTYTGTNQGEFRGVSPTGKEIKFSGVILQRIANGKIVEEWNEFDAFGMLRQLGLITFSRQTIII
jgi:predicted ester cyclase